MSDEARSLIERSQERKQAALTPEQRRYREQVDERNRRIQQGVKQPKSGTFGKAKP